jgi:hypothetical protein
MDPVMDASHSPFLAEGGGAFESPTVILLDEAARIVARFVEAPPENR